MPALLRLALPLLLLVACTAVDASRNFPSLAAFSSSDDPVPNCTVARWDCMPRIDPVGPPLPCPPNSLPGEPFLNPMVHSPLDGSCEFGGGLCALHVKNASTGATKTYLYSTGSVADAARGEVLLYVSEDLAKWDKLPNPLRVMPKWFTSIVWAPHIMQHSDGSYRMYFAGGYNGPSNDTSSDGAGGAAGCQVPPGSPAYCFAIGVASSSQPEGPFVSGENILVEGWFADAIDPFAMQVNGSMHLWYGSTTIGIHTVELTADGLSLLLPGTQNATENPISMHALPEHPIQRMIEAAWIHKRPDLPWYYLFVSGPGYGYIYNYQVTVTRSLDPLYFDLPDGSVDPLNRRVILSGSNDYVSPGHNSMLSLQCAEEGQVDWIVYHAYPRNNTVPMPPKHAFFSRITWSEDGWPSIEGGVPQLKNEPFCQEVNTTAPRARAIAEDRAIEEM